VQATRQRKLQHIKDMAAANMTKQKNEHVAYNKKREAERVASALEAEAEANNDSKKLKDKADLATKATETEKSTAQRNRKAT
jgi:hypothetical protein